MTNKSTTGVPNIDRRELIPGAIALVGGAGVSSCGGNAGGADAFSGELQYFDREQMRILASVVDILIPATDTPGARGRAASTSGGTTTRRLRAMIRAWRYTRWARPVWARIRASPC